MKGEFDEHGSKIVTPNYQSHIDEHGIQTIEIKIPGVKKDEISVDLSKKGRVLIASGNRHSENKSPNLKVEEKRNGKDNDDKKQKQN